jgi:hypothetical protein
MASTPFAFAAVGLGVDDVNGRQTAGHIPPDRASRTKIGEVADAGTIAFEHGRCPSRGSDRSTRAR